MVDPALARTWVAHGAALTCCLVLTLTVVTSTASADVTAITKKSARTVGASAGKSYREVEIQVSGTASGGHYSVPAVLAYPSHRSHQKSFALVDPYNTVTYWIPGSPIGPQLLPGARLFLQDDYIFGDGNLYISVLWDKVVVESRGEGFIATSSDAYDILRDVSTLVRNPKSMPYPRRFRRPAPASKVVVFGYSQTANLLRDFYSKHENTSAGLTFDGAVFVASGGACVNPADLLSFYPCAGVVSDGGKVIVVNTELDVEAGGFTQRGQTTDYRVMELAGVAHIPAPLIDFRALGNPNQNPISPRPALRAVHHNLRRWIKGSPPPASQYITLQDVPPVDIGGVPYLPAAHDDDGNAVGGVRLPHMPSVSHGKPAGAPLGTYGGAFSSGNFYLLVSGTFFPFSDARLHELYPTHEVYVDRVRRAADLLLRNRHILKSDRAAYVSAARDAPVPR